MHRAHRALLYPIAIIAGLATVIVAPTAPASARTAGAITPTTWAYVDSAAPDTSFLKPAGDIPIGTRDGAHTYRAYFTFDLTERQGHVVHDAIFSTAERTVDNCTVGAAVELWRTGPFESSLTWQNQPAELELLHQTVRGTSAGSACPGYLGAGLQTVIAEAVARHETTITFELRIDAATETTPGNGRTVLGPGLIVTSNFPPTVSALGLRDRDDSCGTPDRHPTHNGWTTEFQATVVDRDDAKPTTRFAVWPVDRPGQRREFRGKSGNGVMTATTDLGTYADGTELAWSVQAKDSDDASEWAPPCYLTVDRTPPASVPVVTSSTYPEGTVASGGTGVAGQFRFDAGGDLDVVGFMYADDLGGYQQVAADQPGGFAIIEYTPRTSGQAKLTVMSYDAAHNVGAETIYQFTVRGTAPWGSIDVAGVGLPSTITLHTWLPEVTSFGYQLDGQAEVLLPATGGVGTGQLTFPKAGAYQVAIRAYAGTRMIGADRLFPFVSDAPVVESAEFATNHKVVAGTPGTFTFRPRTTGVVAYEIDFGGGARRVDAAADGTATLRWTPETGRWYSLPVVSIQADGARSMTTYYQFTVLDPHPRVSASELSAAIRRDGVGQPLRIELYSELPNLAGYAYRFNGGPEQTLSDAAASQQVTVTPDHAGDNTIVVVALLTDGTRSPATTYTFKVSSGPIVTWSPPGDATVGRSTVFTFSPGLPGVQAYRYMLGYGDEATVAAGPDGTASVAYTPTWPGNHDVQVTSIGADGTESETRRLDIDVRDNAVTVSGSLNDSEPGGGLGGEAVLTFYTELFGEVVEYRYQLNDDSEQTIPAATDSATTRLSITLTRNGLNTLSVRSRTATGELSPVAEYRFLVGTAPHVVSAQYPNYQWGGGAGVTGTFEFSGGTAGIASFEYRFDDGAATTVLADGSGRASMTYTPVAGGEIHTLTVTGHLADGTATDVTTYQVYVGHGQ